MRFVQFLTSKKSQSIGVQLGNNGPIVNLNDSSQSKLPTRLIDFLNCDPDPVQSAERILQGSKEPPLNLSDVTLLSPITQPDKVICIGLNYLDHCTEQNLPVPPEPVIFSKFSSTIVGPFDNVIHSNETDSLDWEVELAIVIKKAGKNIAKSEAMNHVLGYTVGFDVSARDWQLQKNAGQWLIGKSMDTFCPLGPAIVTVDELGDPHNLNIKCLVNGVEKQSSNTNQLIHKTEYLIEFISRFVTLLPGDVILTGTPPGVGVFKKPPEYLKKGDIVVCEIQNIGRIENKIV